uniref:PSP domain-containing protein n=1 Tax=Steinernema glaseri TaxID=37863 RepID=A0A1I7XZV1_9BILA
MNLQATKRSAVVLRGFSVPTVSSNVSMSEEGELSPSPSPSASPRRNGNASNVQDDDDVIIVESKESVVTRHKSSSPPLFDFDTDINGEPLDDDVQILNVTGGINSEDSIRKSLSTHSLLMTFATPETPKPNNSGRRNKPVCFNCDGDHILAKCPEPRDNNKIRAAAQKFKRDSIGGTPRNSREATSSASGPSKYRPGRISSTLREALNMRNDDIPEWVYRMRRVGFIQGYPPAYLKQALVVGEDPRTLLSFNFIDEKLNEQETVQEQTKEFVPPTINKDKIIWYGGFNKYFSNLYDRENGTFRIPPFESFVAQLEKSVQAKAQKDWEHQKRFRAQKRKRFSDVDASPSSSEEGAPEKRPRLDQSDLTSSDELANESANNESLLSINEASMCSSTVEDSPIGFSTEFDAGVDAPDIVERPFNTTAEDLGRFSVGIQPFQETIEQAQGDGKFLKSLMELMKARRSE